MKVYLDVPYSEKDEAKALGAKWNAKIKKWYADTEPENYVQFAKWILGNSDEAILATEYIFILENTQNCWKCGKPTKVIGLGLGEYTQIYNDGDGAQYEICEDYVDPGPEIHLSWVDREEDIPPRLLRYLQEHYSVKTGYSKTAGKCFANHCDHCGAIQGNWFLFHEPDSPLSTCVEDEELKTRMRTLVVKGIPIEDDIKLNWNTSYCSNDYAYLKYGTFKELVLSSDPQNEYISYEELYYLD